MAEGEGEEGEDDVEMEEVAQWEEGEVEMEEVEHDDTHQ